MYLSDVIFPRSISPEMECLHQLKQQNNSQITTALYICYTSGEVEQEKLNEDGTVIDFEGDYEEFVEQHGQ